MIYTGRKKAIESPELFSKHIDNFISYCQDNNYIPTDYRLMKYLDIPYSTFMQYINGGYSDRDRDDIYKPYAEVYKNLVKFREQFFSEMAVNNPRQAPFAIFSLKQAKNGGYSDTPQLDITAKELTVKTAGIGDKAFD